MNSAVDSMKYSIFYININWIFEYYRYPDIRSPNKVFRLQMNQQLRQIIASCMRNRSLVITNVIRTFLRISVGGWKHLISDEQVFPLNGLWWRTLNDKNSLSFVNIETLKALNNRIYVNIGFCDLVSKFLIKCYKSFIIFSPVFLVLRFFFFFRFSLIPWS